MWYMYLPNAVSIQLKLLPFLLDFLPILAKIWLPWQRLLDPCTEVKSSLNWSTTKIPVISNQILAISHRNAFVVI